jgi:hypothetical protein
VNAAPLQSEQPIHGRRSDELVGLGVDDLPTGTPDVAQLAAELDADLRVLVAELDGLQELRDRHVLHVPGELGCRQLADVDALRRKHGLDAVVESTARLAPVDSHPVFELGARQPMPCLCLLGCQLTPDDPLDEC